MDVSRLLLDVMSPNQRQKLMDAGVAALERIAKDGLTLRVDVHVHNDDLAMSMVELASTVKSLKELVGAIFEGDSETMVETIRRNWPTIAETVEEESSGG